MTTPATINVQTLIDSHKLSRLQLTIIVLCFLVMTIDGFDTAAIGFIAPAIGREWSLAPAMMGPLFGAGLFGGMIGSFVFGPLADRFGRRTILILATICFGVMSLLSSAATDLQTLIILRFLTGIGLGGALPNAITLTSEYCPEKRRSLLVTCMFCGFTVGSALGGFIAAHMVAAMGWRAVLITGGVVPLLLIPGLILGLPESIRFLVRSRPGDLRIMKILHQVAPHHNFVGAKFIADAKAAGGSVEHLFRGSLLTGTLVLWITFFMSLLVVYMLSSWLPTLIVSTGTDLALLWQNQIGGLQMALRQWGQVGGGDVEERALRTARRT